VVLNTLSSFGEVTRSSLYPAAFAKNKPMRRLAVGGPKRANHPCSHHQLCVIFLTFIIK
jgi:hypothetical protein